MCNFLSAIVKRNGDVVCDPEHTDSHEDLVANEGLPDMGNGEFVRVEFTPGKEIDDPATWNLTLDETMTPIWWTDEMRDQVRSFLERLVSNHIVRENRKVLLGGWWILASGAEVKKLCSARTYAMLDMSKVGAMRGTSTVGTMLGTSTVGTMRDTSMVDTMRDMSKVETMRDTSMVGTMLDTSMIETMWDMSTVGTMLDTSTAPRASEKDNRNK